jgi:hypothetical protein
MNKWKPSRTEFYEAAVKMGFYGNELGGLAGKKDNVRKFWEDIYVKKVCELMIELDHLAEYRQAFENVWERLTDYQIKWNRIVILLDALLHHDDVKVKDFIEYTDIEQMSDESKFLTWLFRNADRFPVADFWASVIGPQVAVVLRNIEMSYAKGVGCGHGLVFAAEIIK